MFGKKRTTGRPRTCDHGDALLRPWGHPGADPIPQGDSALQQAEGFFHLLSQHLHAGMLRLLGGADDHLPRDLARQSHRTGLLEAVAGWGAACAAVPYGFSVNRDAPVRGDVRCEAPPPRLPVRGRVRILGEKLRAGLHDLLERRSLGRPGVLRLPPAWPASDLLQAPTQRLRPRTGLSPSESQRGLQAAVSPQRQVCVCRHRGGVQDLGRQGHGLAQGMAEQVQRLLDPTGTKQRGGIQPGPSLPGPAAPGLLCQGPGPIQQGLSQVVGDEPPPDVAQRARAAGGRRGAKAGQPQLPALVHHGQRDRVSITDVAIRLPPRGQGQQARVARLVAASARGIACGQRVRQVCVQERVAARTQKHQKLPRLAGTGGSGLLFGAQREGWIPPDGLLKVEG